MINLFFLTFIQASSSLTFKDVLFLCISLTVHRTKAFKFNFILKEPLSWIFENGCSCGVEYTVALRE